MLIELDPEEEKEQQKALEEEFKPLVDWLKAEAKDVVRDGAFLTLLAKLKTHAVAKLVTISNRLVKSPCAIVAATGGYTANVQKMMGLLFILIQLRWLSI